MRPCPRRQLLCCGGQLGQFHWGLFPGDSCCNWMANQHGGGIERWSYLFNSCIWSFNRRTPSTVQLDTLTQNTTSVNLSQFVFISQVAQPNSASCTKLAATVYICHSILFSFYHPISCSCPAARGIFVLGGYFWAEISIPCVWCMYTSQLAGMVFRILVECVKNWLECLSDH